MLNINLLYSEEKCSPNNTVQAKRKKKKDQFIDVRRKRRHWVKVDQVLFIFTCR